MQKRDDETLVAYLDGEIDAAERRQVEAWLDSDLEARDRLAALAESTNLVRSAYAEFVNEPVPDRLIAAARGEAAAVIGQGNVVPLMRPEWKSMSATRWWIGVAAAAGLFGLAIGGAGGFFGNGLLSSRNAPGERQVAVAASASNWLDNAAAYYKLSVNAGDSMLVDVPASSDSREALQKISQSLPQQVRLPDLKPWGLTFRGTRLVVFEGHPAAQLIYTTDNKAIGPLTLLIGATKQADVQPTLDRRQDVNELYWRHGGRAYVLVGQTDVGYLWGIANDVAWQLDAI
jgi:anti-sigma factor RsiW